uniref:Peptidase M12A domain-containing protein n=1 Tax=Acrobeloides nanus TaxID=290746 RepID=A0A914DQ64_9BILA
MKLIYLLVLLFQSEYAYFAKDDNSANGKDKVNDKSSNGNDKPYKHMLTGKNGFTPEKFERIKAKLQAYNVIHKSKHANKHDNTTATSLLVENLELNDFLDHLRPYQYNMETGLGDYLWNGDIVISEEFIDRKLAEAEADDGREKRQIVTDPTRVWTLPIPYYFDSSVLPEFVNLVVADLAKTMGFRRIFTSVYYPATCYRYDRDTSIFVDYSNIQSSMQYNYAKETTSTTTNYGMPYDFGSNMHYGPCEF